MEEAWIWMMHHHQTLLLLHGLSSPSLFFLDSGQPVAEKNFKALLLKGLFGKCDVIECDVAW